MVPTTGAPNKNVPLNKSAEQKTKAGIIDQRNNTVTCKGCCSNCASVYLYTDLNSGTIVSGATAKERIPWAEPPAPVSYTELTIIHRIHEYLIGEYKIVNRYGLSLSYVNSTAVRRGAGAWRTFVPWLRLLQGGPGFALHEL